MKILLLVQIFETPHDTGSDRHYYFAKYLQSKGHEVCVITGNVDYKNACKRFPNVSGILEKRFESILIKYVPVYTNFRGSFLRRIFFFISFFVNSVWFALREPKIDAIYAISTPLSVGLLGVLVSKVRNKPLFFEVTDVWPDAAIHSGVIKNRLVIYIAEVVEKLCYETSHQIICLTNGILSAINKKGAYSAKTKFIPNGVDFDLFRKIGNDAIAELRSTHNFSDKFVFMYMGAHGRYNSLETIIQAAKILRENTNIFFVFVGEGDEKSKLIEFSSKHQMNNVLFLGTLSRLESVKLLASADGFLLPNRKGDFFKGNLPNKLFDYLAAAKPVIVSGYGESADLIQAAEAGLVIDAENPEGLVHAILNIIQMDVDQANAMGLSGRAYVEKNFSRKVHAEFICDLISNQ